MGANRGTIVLEVHTDVERASEQSSVHQSVERCPACELKQSEYDVTKRSARGGLQPTLRCENCAAMHDPARKRARQDSNKTGLRASRDMLREILKADGGTDKVKALEQHRKARAGIRKKSPTRAKCSECRKCFDAYHHFHKRCAECQLRHEAELNT
jgi:hypothetical protein